MNPHTNIIHKVMPFKRTVFFSADNKQRCFFKTDTMATGGADLRPMSVPQGTLLAAVRRCVDYPLCPASLWVWLCAKEQKSLLSVASTTFELGRFLEFSEFSVCVAQGVEGVVVMSLCHFMKFLLFLIFVTGVFYIRG
jgi:hypothetical protein